MEAANRHATAILRAVSASSLPTFPFARVIALSFLPLVIRQELSERALHAGESEKSTVTTPTEQPTEQQLNSNAVEIFGEVCQLFRKREVVNMGRKPRELNPQQEKFVEFYCQSGNVYQSAIKAGYSPNYAYKTPKKLMGNPNIQKAISSRMQSMKSEKIAETKEILEYLTSVMRGTHEDEMAMNVGRGNGITAVEKVKLKVGAKDRIRAAELLAKVNGLFLNRQELEISNAIPVVIRDDI